LISEYKVALLSMKKMVFAIFLIIGAFNILQAQEWSTDFNEAKRIASENDIPILVLFSGSDWCAPCIKLERQVLSTPKFMQYAKDNYVLIKADFPRKKRNQLPEAIQNQNNELAEKYNRSGGFPLVVVLDKDGKKLGEVGYKKVTPDLYLELLNKMIK